MRQCSLIAIALLALLQTSSTPCHAQDQFTPPSHQAISTAIHKGVVWLKQAQRKNGSWGPCVSGGNYSGSVTGRECCPLGPTAFSIFTLAKCEVSKGEPVVEKALDWLRAKDENLHGRDEKPRCSSYESAAIVLMLTALHESRSADGKKKAKIPRAVSALRPPEGSLFKRSDWRWMHRHVTLLSRGQIGYGGWGYWIKDNVYHDVSASQFALLALRAAVRAGYPLNKLKPRLWYRAIDGLHLNQLSDGRFRYHEGYPWTAGMTAAGVSSLLICKEQMQLAGQRSHLRVEPAIERGFEGMGKSFAVTVNLCDPDGPQPAYHGAYHYCHLYAIERVGALSGRREFGGRAWYPRGAAFLLERQFEDGSWRDRTCMSPKDVLGTCFALLFLMRATRPTITIPTDR